MDLIIQTKCNNCGAVTASQEVKTTNPESRDEWGDGLPFTLAPCCSENSANPCVTLVVMTRDEWLKVWKRTGEPAVYNGTIVQAAKDLLNYTSSRS